MKGLSIRLMLVFALLFGSIGVPALADGGTSGHAIEMIDNDCHASDPQDDGKANDSSQPAGHADHHHCSAGLLARTMDIANDVTFRGAQIRALSDAALHSHATAPPTQPPSA